MTMPKNLLSGSTAVLVAGICKSPRLMVSGGDFILATEELECDTKIVGRTFFLAWLGVSVAV